MGKLKQTTEQIQALLDRAEATAAKLDAFMATKDQPNGLARLGADGLLPAEYLGSRQSCMQLFVQRVEAATISTAALGSGYKIYYDKLTNRFVAAPASLTNPTVFYGEFPHGTDMGTKAADGKGYIPVQETLYVCWRENGIWWYNGTQLVNKAGT